LLASALVAIDNAPSNLFLSHWNFILVSPFQLYFALLVLQFALFRFSCFFVCLFL